MASALFGSGPIRSKNLVEFKAGRMNLKGKMVHPDKRKGLVYVYQSEDSLMHFCWKDRSNGIVEDDLMIFPDDIEIKRVPQCTTGRVFLMRFKSSNKKFFFWMQETDTEKDEKLWKKVNDLLNNPPAPGSASSSVTSASGAGGERGAASSASGAVGGVPGGLPGVLGGDFGNLEGPDLHNLIGSMSDQQLQMFLGGFMPVNSPSSNRSGGSSNLSSNQASRVQSTTPASRTEPTSVAAAAAASSQPASAVPTSATTESKPAVASASQQDGTASQQSLNEPKPPAETSNGAPKMQFSDFQNILGNLAANAGGGGRSDLDLSDVLTLDVMAPILSNKDVQARLVEHLPESPDILAKNEHELRQTITTPQFKKALSSFCMALQSGQLGPVFKQFDLPDEVSNAAAQGNLEAFAKAMEAHAKKNASAKKAQDDDAMDTK